MAANITVSRASVRKDLHDEDSSNYRWTDAVLDRHIGRAVVEYSIADPLEQKTVVVATPNSRDVSIVSLANLVDVENVEWPLGEFPPRSFRFSDVLQNLSDQGNGQVVFVDSRNTLADTDWANEIHPKPDGFAKIARQKWSPKLRNCGLAN